MSDRSAIEWTDATWNPVRGCTKVSPGTLLRHSYRDKLLNASEFNFMFIERDLANLAALEAELSRSNPSQLGSTL